MIKLSQNFESEINPKCKELAIEAIKWYYNWSSKHRFIYLQLLVLKKCQPQNKFEVINCLVELFTEITPQLSKNFYEICLQDSFNEMGE